jgi:hypothetical protein
MAAEVIDVSWSDAMQNLHEKSVETLLSWVMGLLVKWTWSVHSIKLICVEEGLLGSTFVEPMLDGVEEPVELPWWSAGLKMLIATVPSAQDGVLVGIRTRVASSAGLQKAEGKKLPIGETRQCITRWPRSFNYEVKVRIYLSFMIRLVLEKVDCSPSWLRSFVHTVRSFIDIHWIGFDPVTDGHILRQTDGSRS